MKRSPGTASERPRADPRRAQIGQRQDADHRRPAAPSARPRAHGRGGQDAAPTTSTRPFTCWRAPRSAPTSTPGRCGRRRCRTWSASSNARPTSCVCEGVMGLFDGTGPDGEAGSTAELARPHRLAGRARRRLQRAGRLGRGAGRRLRPARSASAACRGDPQPGRQRAASRAARPTRSRGICPACRCSAR